MGKGPRFAQNGEVATDAVTAHDAVVSRDAAAPGRQRPEEILAQTLTGPAHPEASDGWSPRGRRVFLIALAVAGVVLLVAGRRRLHRPGKVALSRAQGRSFDYLLMR